MELFWPSFSSGWLSLHWIIFHCTFSPVMKREIGSLFFLFWWLIGNFQVVNHPKLQETTIWHQGPGKTGYFVRINKDLLSEFKSFKDSSRLLKQKRWLSHSSSAFSIVYLPRSDVFHLWFALPRQLNSMKGTIKSSQCHITCFMSVCVSIHTVNYPQVRFAAATQVCYCFFENRIHLRSHKLSEIFTATVKETPHRRCEKAFLIKCRRWGRVTVLSHTFNSYRSVVVSASVKM